MKRLAILIGGTAAAWLLLAVPAALFLDGPPLAVTAAAAALCLFPAVLTLVISDKLRHRPAEEKIAIVLAATFLRMALAVGGGILLYFQVPLMRERVYALVTWSIVFYVVTLIVETTLMYRDAAAAEKPNREQS